MASNNWADESIGAPNDCILWKFANLEEYTVYCLPCSKISLSFEKIRDKFLHDFKDFWVWIEEKPRKIFSEANRKYHSI